MLSQLLGEALAINLPTLLWIPVLLFVQSLYRDAAALVSVKSLR